MKLTPEIRGNITIVLLLVLVVSVVSLGTKTRSINTKVQTARKKLQPPDKPRELPQNMIPRDVRLNTQQRTELMNAFSKQVDNEMKSVSESVDTSSDARLTEWLSIVSTLSGMVLGWLGFLDNRHRKDLQRKLEELQGKLNAQPVTA